jgi:predicted flap endonuclease-1-like 5' DNA nuclease
MLSLGAFVIGSGTLYATITMYHKIVDGARIPWLDNLFPRQKKKTPSVAPETSASSTAQAEVVAPTLNPVATVMIDEKAALERKILITTLSGATTLIHLQMGIAYGSTLFLLNGVGFAGLLAAYYFVPPLTPYRRYTRPVFMGYTGVTIVAYFVKWGVLGFASSLGMFTKLVEAGLIVLLWQDGKGEINRQSLNNVVILDAGDVIEISVTSLTPPIKTIELAALEHKPAELSPGEASADPLITGETPLTPSMARLPQRQLELIKGIGPVFAERLNQAGIMTLADLAQQTPAQIREIVLLGKPGRSINPEDWIAQARDFIEKSE